MSSAAKQLLFSALSLGAVVIACGGATETELFGSVASSSSNDAGVSGSSDGGSTITDAGGDASQEEEQGVPCVAADGSNCAEDEYCRVTACADEGFCVKRPAVEQTSFDPVCSCTGITYWNASIAARAHANVASASECPAKDARTCSLGQACPEDSFCSASVKSSEKCPIIGNGSGTCWGLPSACPEDGPSTRRCANGSCESRCAIIRDQVAYYGANQGPAGCD